jgi:hypothetical protein
VSEILGSLGRNGIDARRHPRLFPFRVSADYILAVCVDEIRVREKRVQDSLGHREAKVTAHFRRH